MWQPLDTAPRNGKYILLFIPNYGVIQGFYFTSPKQFEDGWETIVGSIGEPTFWMPLMETPDAA
jgi:hypothetical protein